MREAMEQNAGEVTMDDTEIVELVLPPGIVVSIEGIPMEIGNSVRAYTSRGNRSLIMNARMPEVVHIGFWGVFDGCFGVSNNG